MGLFNCQHSKYWREMAPKLAEEIAKLRREVEQLRRENDLERIPTSEAVADIIAYMKENAKEEQLLRNNRNFKDLVDETKNPFVTPSPWTPWKCVTCINSINQI